jgi:hypothetical protein
MRPCFAAIPTNVGVIAPDAVTSSSTPSQVISPDGVLLGEVYIFTASLQLLHRQRH